MQNDNLYYMPGETVDKRDDSVDKGGGKTTEAEFVDAPCQLAVEPIVHNMSESDTVRYVLRWYGYTLASDAVKVPKHIRRTLHY